MPSQFLKHNRDFFFNYMKMPWKAAKFQRQNIYNPAWIASD